MKTIEEMREELEREYRDKNAMFIVLEVMQRELRYNMVTARDENNETLYDENGNIALVEPKETDYEFPYYHAWKKAINEIYKLVK